MATGDQAASDLADYLAKSVELVDVGPGELADGLGLELTHGMAGRASEAHKTRPVWSLLDDLVATGEASALRAWHEWEEVSKGKRQVGWSKGLRERFAPGIEEVSDQAIVDQVVGDERDDLVAWSADEWRGFIAHPTRALDLLVAAQSGGLRPVLDLLREWGEDSFTVVANVLDVPAGVTDGGGAGGPPQSVASGGARDGRHTLGVP
jgi:hypothetical protein